MQSNRIKNMTNAELIHFVDHGFVNEKDPEQIIELVRELAGRLEDFENELHSAKEYRGEYEYNG